VPSSVNYRAVATYTARSPRELDFDINEVVRLIELLSDDWLQVQNAVGDIGIVPSNHLERLYKCVRPLFIAIVVLDLISADCDHDQG
jgi:adenosyl cobinamide kinase/adenosyl cobinamide phosphate guanylyltransferase